MASNLKTCPSCNIRALAPFLGPKRRCKNCGTYVDVLDLLFQQAGSPAGSAPALAVAHAASPAMPAPVAVEQAP